MLARDSRLADGTSPLETVFGRLQRAIRPARVVRPPRRPVVFRSSPSAFFLTVPDRQRELLPVLLPAQGAVAVVVR